MLRIIALLLVLAAPLLGARRILYVTHSAGYRHDSIVTSLGVLRSVAERNGKLEITATEDLSLLNAANLAQYDALFFFSSGELPLLDQQKQDLLDFVRSGKGFGGVHSATDTLYGWEPYGQLIGAYFDGHPWVHEASVQVEDPDFPGMSGLGPSFRMVEEFYQFRAFSRDRVRVLMTLDSNTIDLGLPGVNRTDRDFALAWCHNFGRGRVFYSALGHFDETWLDARFQQMLEGALLWLVDEVRADATPRSNSLSPLPEVAPGGVKTLAGASQAQAPGSLVVIQGRNLSSGSSMSAAAGTPLPSRLAGTSVEANGALVPLLSVSPGEIRAQLPFDLTPGTITSLAVRSVNVVGRPVALDIVDASPALFSGFAVGRVAVLYATGLGVVEGAVAAGAIAPLTPLLRVRTNPRAILNGVDSPIDFAGLAPALVGVYQVNVLAAAPGPWEVRLESGGLVSNTLTIP